MSGFVRDGRALHYTEVALSLGLSPHEALTVQRDLTASGLPIWTHPDTDHLAAASPFSNIPPRTVSRSRANRSGTRSEGWTRWRSAAYSPARMCRSMHAVSTARSRSDCTCGMTRCAPFLRPWLVRLTCRPRGGFTTGRIPETTWISSGRKNTSNAGGPMILRQPRVFCRSISGHASSVANTIDDGWRRTWGVADG